MERRYAALLVVVALLAGCSALPAGDAGTASAPTPNESAATDVPDATPTTDPGASTATATASETEGDSQTATPTETPTASDPSPSPADDKGPGGDVYDDEKLAVDRTRVRENVEQLIDGDTGYPTVSVQPSLPEREVAATPGGNPLLRTAGLVDQSASGEPLGWYFEGRIVIVTDTLDPWEQEQVLAHEYVHAIQDTDGWLRPDWYGTVPNSLDATLTASALSEGSAEYVDTVYVEEYMNESPGLDESVQDAYLNGSPSSQFTIAPYYLGSQYAERNTDTPRELPELMDDAPQTTEQLLHDETQETEPPAGLVVRTGEVRPGADSRQGELVTRLVLRSELNRSRAIEAAEGWGDDRLYQPDGPSESAFVWATRWDDASEADEFESALRDWTDSRDDSQTLRVERTAPETVVLIGTANATVEGTNESVTVSTGAAS